jgi:enoyl-CoA hydratase/carnithine racemase
MYAELADILDRADGDESVRVVVFTGSGDSFAAGNDLQEFLDNPPSGDTAPVWRFMLTLAQARLPLVAAVNGVAVGIGVTMLLHCEQVLCSTEATFSLPFVNLGVVPEAGSTLLLPQCAGFQRAARLLLLGESFDAQTAYDAGIAGELLAPADVLPAAMAFAEKLAAKPRSALLATKNLLRSDSQPVAERISTEARLFEQHLKTPAAREALSAFVDRRNVDTSKFD